MFDKVPFIRNRWFRRLIERENKEDHEQVSIIARPVLAYAFFNGHLFEIDTNVS